MTMTRKHFEAIASIVEDRTHQSVDGSGIIYPWELIADLAVYFRSENPRFNRDKFVRACSPKEP